MAKKTKGKSAPAKGKKKAARKAAAKRTKSSKAGKIVKRGLVGAAVATGLAGAAAAVAAMARSSNGGLPEPSTAPFGMAGKALDSGTPTLINAVIDPAAGSESGRIGNLNPQSKLSKKK